MASDAARRSLVRQLDAIGVPYELIAHRPTQTALEEAEALDVQASRVAKTIVLTTSVGFVRAVLPASRRLDLDKVRDLLGTKRVELASEHVLARRYPDFDLGAVPPLAGSPDDRVLVDGRLVGGKTVLIEAGTHDQSLRLKIADLIALTGALLGDLCKDTPGPVFQL
jgi:Ala-tRNA(Pro) deacylase